MIRINLNFFFLNTFSDIDLVAIAVGMDGDCIQLGSVYLGYDLDMPSQLNVPKPPTCPSYWVAIQTPITICGVAQIQTVEVSLLLILFLRIIYVYAILVINLLL